LWGLNPPSAERTDAGELHSEYVDLVRLRRPITHGGGGRIPPLATAPKLRIFDGAPTRLARVVARLPDSPRQPIPSIDSAP